MLVAEPNSYSLTNMAYVVKQGSHREKRRRPTISRVFVIASVFKLTQQQELLQPLRLHLQQRTELWTGSLPSALQQ